MSGARRPPSSLRLQVAALCVLALLRASLGQHHLRPTNHERFARLAAPPIGDANASSARAQSEGGEPAAATPAPDPPAAGGSRAPPSAEPNATRAPDETQVGNYEIIKHYSLLSANAAIFVVGFIGNLVVIVVIFRFTRTETVTDRYILNLAMADLMFIMGLVFLITTMIIDNWIFGHWVCKLYMSLTSLNQFASSLLLVVMSFDRFIAVCHPIYAQRFRQTRGAKLICACIWVVSLVLMSPIFLFAKIHREAGGEERTSCSISWPETKVLGFSCEWAFTLYSFAIGFAVPLLLIAGFYSQVVRKLRIAASGPISLGSSRRSRSREETNRRIEHLVIGIICTYTICWLPYWITQIIISSISQAIPESFQEVAMVSSCLSYINSALNPILYAFLSDNFKRRCSEILRSIYELSWCRRRACAISHSAATTTQCADSELSRPESRQAALLLSETPAPNHAPADARRPHANNSKLKGPAAPAQDPVAESLLADCGQVYCGERKRSVAFGASTYLERRGQDV